MCSAGFEQVNFCKNDLIIQLFEFFQERLGGGQCYSVLLGIYLPAFGQ